MQINPLLVSGLVGAMVGAATALISQFLAHRLAEKRDLKRFQLQSFERFRREFSEDQNLRRISLKKAPLAEDEIDDYLGFFEEVGLYFVRGLVDIELVDEILGDSIMAAWQDDSIKRAVVAIRDGENDPSYFRCFEQLANHLIKLRNARTQGGPKWKGDIAAAPGAKPSSERAVGSS